jgi:hypothetical protein
MKTRATSQKLRVDFATSIGNRATSRATSCRFMRPGEWNFGQPAAQNAPCATNFQDFSRFWSLKLTLYQLLEKLAHSRCDLCDLEAHSFKPGFLRKIYINGRCLRSKKK